MLMLAALPAASALAQVAPAEAPDPGLSEYRRFLIYPYQQRGYAALRAGDERAALAAFGRARELAPRSVRTALDLAEAYRRFGHPAEARAVLRAQQAATPGSASVRAALAGLRSAPDCRRDDAPACRAQRGYAALRQGRLRAAARELEDAAFAAGADGLALRRALAQRAVYLHRAEDADAAFAALDRAGQLRPGERAQWLQVLLQRGRFADAQALIGRPGTDTVAARLALAQALADRGETETLVEVMEGPPPAFRDETAERQWLYLLARVARTRPDLLLDYRPTAPRNRALQAGLAVPVAMARGDTRTAQVLLARLPQARFRMTRFELALQDGRFAEAGALADAMLAAADGGGQLDPLSYRLIEAGADDQALRLLLAAYPFDGDPQALDLMARLAVLVRARPAAVPAAARARLRQPLPGAGPRSAQVPILAALDDCEGIRAVMADGATAYPAAHWRMLAECYRRDFPGLAEYAFARAHRGEPDATAARALAYQAHAAHDYAAALRTWRALDATDLRPQDRIAAATTALAAGEPEAAKAWLDAYAARGGRTDDRYWWLRAQSQELRDPAQADADLRRAIALRPDPRYYEALAALQARSGSPAQAAEALELAQAMAPDDTRLAANLGYAYLQMGAPDKAAAQLERAHRADPDDAALTRQLVYLNQQLGDREAARRYAARAIDQFDEEPAQDDATGGADERYALRRLHEDLGRQWRVLADLVLGDSVSSASNAFAPGVAYRSYAQVEAQYRIDTGWHGADADTLAAYARVFAGSGEQGALWPVHGSMLGVGLHWKPWRTRTVVFSAEQQVPLAHDDTTRSDVLLRASASWTGGPAFSDDWHPSGDGWLAQNLYLDAARYLHARRTALTADYRLGLHRKLAGAQTLEPYVRLQFNGLERGRGQGFGRDLRAGLGLQWNAWRDEDRYDAFRRRFSVGLEWQHAFTSYLHERNAVYLSLGARW